MATAWNWPDSGGGNLYEIAGLQVFRNFDGNGGTFGDTSIHAVTTDDAASSVYASVASGNVDQVVIVAINKKTTAATAGISWLTRPISQAAKVYTLTSAGPKLAGGPGHHGGRHERVQLHDAPDVGVGHRAAKVAPIRR